MESPHPFDTTRVTRPIPRLMTWYFLQALAALPVFPIVLLVRYFRYRSLRYRLDAEGISMSWGIIYRREIHLTYARIQDIHLVSNVVERWLGLARLHIQTASGQTGAEMTLEGLEDVAATRDYLYSKMRGVKEDAPADSAGAVHAAASTDSDLAGTFEELAAEVGRLRDALARRRAGSP